MSRRTACAGLIVATIALRATQAGEPPTARIMVNPVPAKVGPPYPPLTDGGPNIVGNELRLDAGGVRVWVEVQLADWDPNGDGSPGASAFVVTLDGSGLLDADVDDDGDVTNDGDQEDIRLAVVPCTSDATCRAAFGELLPDMECDNPLCRAVYTDKGGFRPDGWCAGEACGCCPSASISGSGWSAIGVYNGDPRPDDGSVRWGATAVYDVPAEAKGKYVVQLDVNETFLGGGVPFQEIPSLAETGFVVKVLTGRCCFGSGTPAPDCVDAVTRAACGDDELPPFVFTPEASCPPVGSDCEVVTGACCDGDPFGPCVDDTLVPDCDCPMCNWYESRT